jgi:hypothetical protein
MVADWCDDERAPIKASANKISQMSQMSQMSHPVVQEIQPNLWKSVNEYITNEKINSYYNEAVYTAYKYNEPEQDYKPEPDLPEQENMNEESNENIVASKFADS